MSAEVATGLLPVALLHGFTGSPAGFDRVIAGLAGKTVTVAPLLSGHGHPGASVTTFEGEVDRIAGQLRKRARNWCVVGYSLGGRVALGLLARHPALFESAVLIGARPGLETDAERAERSRSDGELQRILTEEGIEAFVSRWESLPLFASQAGLPSALLAGQRAARLRHEPHELAASLRATGLSAMPSYWGALPGIEARVHLVVGERDRKFRAIAERMRGLLRRATLTVVGGAGHNVVLEAPDEVCRIVEHAIEAAP